MRPNRVREIWQSGGAVINGWCGIPSGFAAEVMAHMGWDSLVVDMQHGIVDYQAMVSMLQGISTTAVTPMVRVPWNTPADIMKALDAGAYGIICPMVNTRAECEAFVGACRYAPRGYRSSGPIRATLYGGPDYHAKANDTVLAIAMIETREALENLDAVLSTPGLDGIYVGPSDLSISLGHAPGLDKSEEFMISALQKIVDGCKRHKVYAGLHTGGSAYAKRMIAMGFQFATLLGDARLLTMAGQQVIREMREGAPAAAATGAKPASPY
ncbi:MAG TPA: aldolase/citrate lyase family protein [Stellaceae bacterium]|nr:aldolase/citrate lyase family protein [Stellaceae bacterium]